MRTTIDINPDLLEKALAITGEKSKGRAVDRALEELIRRDAIEKLLAARGTFHIEDKTAEWEEEEMRLEAECRNNRRW